MTEVKDMLFFRIIRFSFFFGLLSLSCSLKFYILWLAQIIHMTGYNNVFLLPC